MVRSLVKINQSTHIARDKRQAMDIVGQRRISFQPRLQRSTSHRPFPLYQSPIESMPPHSLFETHLDVHDLGRSIAFYRNVVGLEFAFRVPERHVAFFWIGGRGKSMLGLWSGSSSPNAAKLHIAFALDLDAVLASPSALRRHGVEPLDFAGRPTTEPSVIGWMPAASVFFHDPDGHLLEYLAMLSQEPCAEAGVVPYGEWLGRWAREAG
jgi:lactoylglutathione lyase